MRKTRIAAMVFGAVAGVAYAPLMQAGVLDFLGKVVSAVTGSPRITTTALPPATKDTAYSFTYAATAGTPPYRWYAAKPLPVGMTLTRTGTLSGLLSAPAKISIKVMDAKNKTNTKTLPLSLCSSVEPLRITQSTPDGSPYHLGTFQIGVPVNIQLQVTGGGAPVCVAP